MSTAEVPLGKYTRFSSTPQWSRILRYMLQNEARRILPTKHRTRICQRLIAQGKESVDIMYHPTQRISYYKNLIVCGSLWTCPVCAARITEHRRIELAQAVDRINARCVMVTYTFSHYRGERLRTLRTALMDAYAAMWSGRWWGEFDEEFGIVGSVRALEVTFGENGYHPHYHVLMFLNNDAEVWKLKQELEATLTPRWQQSLKKFGRFASDEHGIKVSVAFKDVDEYIAKYGREPIDDEHWDITREVVKGSAKFGRAHGLTPNEMLLECYRQNFVYDEIWLSYTEGMTYAHQLQWSPGLRELAGLPKKEGTEKAIAESLPDGLELFARISHSLWDWILIMGFRGEVLQIAARGDIEALYDFFERMGYKIEHVDLRDIS